MVTTRSCAKRGSKRSADDDEGQPRQGEGLFGSPSSQLVTPQTERGGQLRNKAEIKRALVVQRLAMLRDDGDRKNDADNSNHHSVSDEAKRMRKDDNVRFSFLSEGATTAEQSRIQKQTVASIQKSAKSMQKSGRNSDLIEEFLKLPDANQPNSNQAALATPTLQPSEAVAPMHVTSNVRSVSHGAKSAKVVEMPVNSAPQIIRLLDDCETCTTHDIKRMTTMLRCSKETKVSNNPKEWQTNGSEFAAECTQKSAENVNLLGQSSPLQDQTVSVSRVQGVSAKSTMQPSEEFTPMDRNPKLEHLPHETERLSMDENFHRASFAGGVTTVQQTVNHMRTAALSIRGSEELNVSKSSFDPFMENLSGILAKAVTVSEGANAQVITSHTECNAVEDDNNDDAEESTSRHEHRVPHVTSPTPVTTAETVSIPDVDECLDTARVGSSIVCASVGGNGSPLRTGDRFDERASNRSVWSSHHCQSHATSLNLIDMVEEMENNECEVDSARFGPIVVSVKGYKVKPEHASLVMSIISNHGDIAANCILDSVMFRSMCMELLCDVLQKLKKINIFGLSLEELENMMATVGDIERQNIDVEWLKNRLQQLSEAVKAIPLLKKSSILQQRYAEYKSHAKRIKMQIEDYKNKIVAAESELLVVEAEAKEAMKVVSEGKAKLKCVVKLGSLLDGLVEP